MGEQDDEEDAEHDAVEDEDPERALAQELEQEVDAEPAHDGGGDDAAQESGRTDRLRLGDRVTDQLEAIPGGGQRDDRAGEQEAEAGRGLAVEPDEQAASDRGAGAGNAGDQG